MKTASSFHYSRFCTAFVSSLAFLASVNQTLATSPAIINGVSSVDGAGATIDGNSESGYFVQSGALTISNATLQNFATKGGDGSGGGAGLGGAIFINDGATATISSVNFLGNSVTGGNGGVGTVGGTLNNLFGSGSTAASGANGYTPTQTSFTDIGGTTGTKGGNGSVAATSFGGTGGNGGAGGNGGDRSESLILGVTSASLDLAGVILEMGSAFANPFTVNVGVGLALSTSSAAINLANAIIALNDFDKSLSDGQIGLGGTGGTGGIGGKGADFFGGGLGGDGGNGGTGGSNWSGSAYSGGAAGGDAGSGGSGGIGGFGAGGGTGGDGGTGGVGAGATSYAATPAQAEVTGTKTAPDTYKTQYFDPTLNGGAGGFVVLQTNQVTQAADTTMSVTLSDTSTATVTVVSVVDVAAHSVPYVISPATPEIPAGTTDGRPSGLDGAGGSGGAGGFGGGAGASGSAVGADVAGGSGGNGFGGAIFVRSGGSLLITGDVLFDQNLANGGDGQAADANTQAGATGSGIGTDLFMMKGSTVVLQPGIGHTITFNGSIADDSLSSGVSSSIADGNGAGLTVQSGLVIFNGTNTYSGQTKISTDGVLQAVDGTGIYANSNINLEGGVLQSSGIFSRFLGTASSRLQWTADGGFSAFGGDLEVRLSNNQALTWGTTGSFIGNGFKLLFGSTSATGVVTFDNAINLGGATRTILVTANLADAANGIDANVDNAIMAGVLSNGGLTVGDATHTGTLILTNTNTYAGGTTINGGMLVLANSYNPYTQALITSGSLNAHGAVTVNTGATFDFSQTSDQTIGTLSGGGTVDMGGNTLTINQDVDGTFSGVMEDGGLGAGEGASLIKQGTAVLTLTGANTYTGTTEVKAGTLELSGSGSLVSNDVTVDSGAILKNGNGGLAADTALTNNGTVNQDADDTIASLVNTGTITGTATLTAATYALNTGSIVNANLGAGALTANGTVALNGTSAASTVEIATGTTTLGSAERLLDTTALTIDSGATLTLGGNEKIGSLFGAGILANAGGRLTADSGNFSGVISGAGGLTKVSTGTLTLSGANTYTGSTLINVGTLTLAGSLVSATVNVASGAILNDENSGLASNTTLTNDGTVNQNSDDTIAALVNTGTINNNDHTLTAATYALNDGSIINANLGTGIVTANGTVALNGTSSAATVNIETGTTTLGSAERLLDTSVVTVSSGAKLALGGSEKIATLDGAGEVSVQLGTLTVDDGTFSGVISGTDDAFGLTKVSSGLLTLSGINTYVGTTQINAGTLTLTGSLASLTVNVASGAILNDEASGLASGATVTNDGTLNQNSDDTIAALVNTGTINNAGHTLTAATYALNDGSIINANLGTGIVTANGTVALNGTSSAATV
ncbi:MAG: autotransporter-associated beta strand repeat-containing protein, partial [Opitutaceae bacterium]